MDRSQSTPSAFVIMPFDDSFMDIYRQFIARALEEAGFSVHRADDLMTQRSILRDVLEGIAAADLVVADLTGGNANVFYELGLAHGLRKPVFLLTQVVDDVPFDLQGYRHIIYDVHFTKITQAYDELKTRALAFRAGRLSIGSPLSDFLPRDSTSMASASGLALAPPEAAPSDDRGFLDFLADAEEAFPRLRQTIEDVVSATQEIGEEASRVGSRINEAVARPAQGTAAHVRKLAKAFSSHVDRYATTLRAANAQYREDWDIVGSGLEAVLTQDVATVGDGLEHLRESLEPLGALEKGAGEARTSFLGLADTMDNLPRMERNLNRALVAASGEVRSFIENCDLTIASVQRARDVASRRLPGAHAVAESRGTGLV